MPKVSFILPHSKINFTTEKSSIYRNIRTKMFFWYILGIFLPVVSFASVFFFIISRHIFPQIHKSFNCVII